MPLFAVFVFLQADPSQIPTTLWAVGGSILASVVVNYVTTTGTLSTVVAKLEGTFTTEIDGIKEDVKELKISKGDQWNKINQIDKDLVRIETNCGARHGKAHHA